MTDQPRLFLLTPVLDEVEPFLPRLTAALGSGAVAALLLRLRPDTDERALVNRVKAVVTAARASETAVIVAGPPTPLLATVAVRGGADGAHTEDLGAIRALRDALKAERSLGVGGLRTKHAAMEAGEAGVDYLLFGEPRPDGYVPDPDLTMERATWWAEIFEPPCAAYAASLSDVADAAATGAEFVALADAVWDHPEGPASGIVAAMRAIAAAKAGEGVA
ncbi:MAG: thiamine phosphate synthase [Methylobacteriaceae bacterium]|nr:thiamine phosphate synthase [Methylobacteriaceae bacterium]